MTSIAALLITVCIVWIWIDTLAAKEVAVKESGKACSLANKQLLDQTVEFKKMWVRFNTRRELLLFRLYFFDYTEDGSTYRFQGRIVLVGKKLQEVNLNAYDMRNTDECG